MAIRALPEHHRDKVTVSKLVAYINQEYSKHWRDNTRPHQGVSELLDALTTMGIKMEGV